MGKIKQHTSKDVHELSTKIGQSGELHQQHKTASSVMTTNHGAAVSDNQNSLRAGIRGSTLMEDFVLHDKMAHFDRERIPERVVHARGAAAHGYFELSTSLEKYTTAKILTEVGQKTPVFARLSTVAGGSGSMDTVRDVRGFAVKFYTSQGNWDLVGNNIPVFFIQDAMKFPDLVHSVKREPDRGYPSAASAHDTFWDFISLMPESMHMLMWVMSDRTLPRSLRMMEGFGVHTFRLINAKGQATFVKYHWRPRLGVQSLIWDEAVKIAGADQDYHRRDLWEAIDQGHYPEWDLAVQLFTEADAEKFDFDPLDATKLIPEEVIPLQVVGKMVLNRNPDNFFTENEQSTFAPSRILPGMDFSEDPLLQGRIFSYTDTQMHRLGSPNLHQLPINQARCPIHHFQRDGHSQMNAQKGQVAYEPNTLDPGAARASAQLGFKSAQSPAQSLAKTRDRSETFGDHYSQARQFYCSQSPTDQAHLASAIVFELSKVQTADVRERTVGHLRHIDESLAKRVANGLAMPTLPTPPKAFQAVKDLPASPPLQTVGIAKNTLLGRCIGILIDDGTEAKSLKTLKAAIEKQGATVKLIAPKIYGAVLSDGTTQAVDGQLAGTPSVLFDAVALILSEEAGIKLSKEASAVDFVRDAYGHLKAISLSQGAQHIFEAAGLQADDFIVQDKYAAKFVNAAAQRLWEREPKVRNLA